jgi:hypothetical protein
VEDERYPKRRKKVVPSSRMVVEDVDDHPVQDRYAAVV